MEIYLIENRVTRKVYIGQTRIGLEARWHQHVHDSTRKNTRFYSSMRKHGTSNFVVSKLAVASSPEQADYLESYFVILHNSDDPDCGYNMTPAGDPNPVRSEEVRRAISAAHMGMPAHNKGKAMSEEQKLKISRSRLLRKIPAWNKGAVTGEEARSKMRAAWTDTRRAAQAERNRKNGLVTKMLAARRVLTNRAIEERCPHQLQSRKK